MVISLFSTPEHGILLQDYFPIDPAYFSKFCDTWVLQKRYLLITNCSILTWEDNSLAGLIDSCWLELFRCP